MKPRVFMLAKLFARRRRRIDVGAARGSAADYRAGEQYTRLDKPVAAAPAVVEFFSFYCGPCYQFAETYRVGSTVAQALPAGEKVTVSRQPDGQTGQ